MLFHAFSVPFHTPQGQLATVTDYLGIFRGFPAVEGHKCLIKNRAVCKRCDMGLALTLKGHPLVSQFVHGRFDRRKFGTP